LFEVPSIYLRGTINPMENLKVRMDDLNIPIVDTAVDLNLVTA